MHLALPCTLERHAHVYLLSGSIQFILHGPCFGMPAGHLTVPCMCLPQSVTCTASYTGAAHVVACLQVIRQYHGHLSGVYAMALHPTLDLLMTGGRDSVCRVWDMRSKVQAHVLTGHDDTVCSILSQGADPQASILSAGEKLLIPY